MKESVHFHFRFLDTTLQGWDVLSRYWRTNLSNRSLICKLLTLIPKSRAFRSSNTDLFYLEIFEHIKFSTSDNAFLALWLVHSILVIGSHLNLTLYGTGLRLVTSTSGRFVIFKMKFTQHSGVITKRLEFNHLISNARERNNYLISNHGEREPLERSRNETTLVPGEFPLKIRGTAPLNFEGNIL